MCEEDEEGRGRREEDEEKRMKRREEIISQLFELAFETSLKFEILERVKD